MNTDIEIRRGLPGDRDALVMFNLAMARETEGGELDRETVKAGVATVFQSKDGGLDRGSTWSRHRPAALTARSAAD